MTIKPIVYGKGFPKKKEDIVKRSLALVGDNSDYITALPWKKDYSTIGYFVSRPQIAALLGPERN